MFRWALLSGALVAVSCGGGGDGYGGGSPTTPSPSPGGGGNATVPLVTIRSDGSIDPKELRVDVQGQVRFTNQDSRPHQPQSNPHLQHTDCPALNNVGVLQPGDSRLTGVFDTAKACGFHDHMNPDNGNLGGTIRVAGAEGPPGPVYIRP
jgi:hypothetical protein